MLFTAWDKDSSSYRFPQNNNKFILLDFTKDHCVPCMQSVSELKAIHKDFSDKLELISFSPDEKQQWLKAISRDQPGWLYLRDGKGAAGPVIMNYGVVAYPIFVLIDPSGTVIAKWSGYGRGIIGDTIRKKVK